MIAFMFPGQGSQYVGMGKALAQTFSICRETLEQADAALGEPLSKLCFEGPAETLTLTENTQPAVLAVSVAVYRLLVSRGLRPALAAGHSLGEYSAHVAAGTISFADALHTVRGRGRYMQEAVGVGEGAMAAVLGLSVEIVDQACEEAAKGEVVSTANLNAPGQVVIAGTREAVSRASTRAKDLGAKRVVSLNVSAPFHCALMEPAQARLEPELRSLVVSDPDIPIIANVDAKPKRDAFSAIEALVKQVSAPVKWEAVVRYLFSSGIRMFVEVGPGTVLSGLVKKIERQAQVASVDDPDGLAKLEALLAKGSSN